MKTHTSFLHFRQPETPPPPFIPHTINTFPNFRALFHTIVIDFYKNHKSIQNQISKHKIHPKKTLSGSLKRFFKHFLIQCDYLNLNV